MGLEIQIPYKGSDYLFQGISQGASNLAAGGEAAIKKYRQIQDAGKAADYFMKAGGDDMYAQAGMHPEQWKTLGPRDKAAVVQGIMEQGTQKKLQAQLEEMHALAQERQQKTQLSQDEADAWPALAQAIMAGRQTASGPMADGGPSAGMTPQPMMDAGPGAQPGPGPGPDPSTGTMPMGGNFSPEEIMAGMAKMGKTSPRLAAALSRTLIPKLMEGSTSGPQSWKSPTGNPYVWMGHNLMPDKTQFDPSEMMGNVPSGYQVMPDGKGGMRVLPEKKPVDAPTQLPAAFWSKLDKLATAHADATKRAGYSDEEIKKFTGGKGAPEDYRKRMQAESLGTLKEIGDHLQAFESEGYGKPETWGLLKKKYGVAAADAGPGAAPAGTVAEPKTQKDFDALPKGAVYINPKDQKKYIKK